MKSLPLINEIPLYEGDIESDIRTMNKKRAEELGGKLSWPSKMGDTPAWGISASRCRIGSVLAQVKGSTCESCYAHKGTFRFTNVQAALEANYQKLFNVLWTPAITAQIRWVGEERFRWFFSGDLQGISHLRNIIRVCLATPEVRHWLPTREAALLRACKDEIPSNLVARLSAAMIDGPAPDWPWTSTVVSKATTDTCPSSVKGGSCHDNDCDACWQPEVQNVPYLKH